MNTSRPRVRHLLLLGCAVLAGHLALLSTSANLRPAGRPMPNAIAWLTRTVNAAVPPALAEPLPTPPASPATPAAAAAPAQPARTLSRAPAKSGPAVMAPPKWELIASAADQPARGSAPRQAVLYRVAPSARLHYKVFAQAKGFQLQGDGELEWRHDGHSYEAHLSLTSPLLPRREQRSSGKVTVDGLEPVRFSDKIRSEEAAYFLREEGKVSFSNNRPDVPLVSGAQDRLSVILQLGALLAGEPRKHPPGSSVTIQTASTRDAEPWVFTVEGREQLELAGGTVQAIKLIRKPREDYDQKVELWLAPGMDYVPVRLRLTNANGDWVDQQWSSTDKG